LFGLLTDSDLLDALTNVFAVIIDASSM